MGHATGLAHPPDGVQAVMSADPAIYARINRLLDPDDIAGIQFLYGAAPTPPQRTYNYQGRVFSGGVPFTGSGLFKFALVNGDGTQTYWQNAPDTSPADGQPDSAVTTAVSAGLFSVRLGDTLLMAPINPFMLGHPDVRLRVWFNDGSHGFQLLAPDRPLGSQSFGGALVPNPFRFEQQGRISISGVPFTGTGQFKFALVNQDGSTTYWRSAADTSPADGEPDTGFSVTLTRGHYSVPLGDSSIMLPMDPTAPAHPDVRLRTWFNDGVHGFQKLTPDRRLGRTALGKAPADSFLLGFQGRIAADGVPFNGTGQFRFALVNGSQVYWTSSVDIAPADGPPDVAVSLTVSQGLYSILLGDGTQTLPIAPEVLANANVSVRVWFSDGVHGFQLLSPDQQVSNPISFGP